MNFDDIKLEEKNKLGDQRSGTVYEQKGTIYHSKLLLLNPQGNMSFLFGIVDLNIFFYILSQSQRSLSIVLPLS